MTSDWEPAATYFTSFGRLALLTSKKTNNPSTPPVHLNYLWSLARYSALNKSTYFIHSYIWQLRRLRCKHLKTRLLLLQRRSCVVFKKRKCHSNINCPSSYLRIQFQLSRSILYLYLRGRHSNPCVDMYDVSGEDCVPIGCGGTPLPPSGGGWYST